MVRLAILCAALLLAACSRDQEAGRVAGERPTRIVSLDYCADQYVLRLADREQILALSPGATGDFSHMRQAARGLTSVRPVAEDVLALKPDLVVRAYGGGPGAAGLFARAGIPVLEVGWTSRVAGTDPGTVIATIRQMADGLGQGARGEQLAAQYQARLDAISHSASGESALYITPGGVTSGPGSLVHTMLDAAGLENFESEPGWRSIPLERLAYESPDRFVVANFRGGAGPWSAARHPLLAQRRAETPVTRLEGAWTSCGGWFVMNAIEALAEPPE